MFLIVPSLFKNKKSKDNKKETEGLLPEEQELLMQSLEGNIANIKKRTGNSSDMVSFGAATRLGEMAVISDDVEMLTGRKPKSLKEVMRESFLRRKAAATATAAAAAAGGRS